MWKSVLFELCWFQPVSEEESHSHEMCKYWPDKGEHLAWKIWTSWSKKFGTNCKGTTGWWIWLWTKEGITFYEPCVDGKQSTLPSPKTGRDRSDELLRIVHSDVSGKIETKLLSGAEYFVTFIDDKSRFVWVYTLKHKSEIFEKLTEWKSVVEKSSGIKWKY